MGRILAAMDSGPTVFVLPHSATQNVGTPDWSRVVDTRETWQDAVVALVLQGQVARVTVSAHSLGRAAILAAISRDGLDCDRLDIEDAFYSTKPQGPQSVAQWWAEHPDASVRVLVTSTGMSTAQVIIQQAPSLRNAIVNTVKAPPGNHWDAELKPWN